MSPSELKKYALFGGLTEEQIENILPFLNEERFSRDELLITEGETNDKIYFLVEGEVIVTKRDIFLARFFEGDVFGEIEVLDVMPAAATIQANTQVKALTVSNNSLRSIYKKDMAAFSLMMMNLARDLSRRLRKMDERFASSPFILK